MASDIVLYDLACRGHCACWSGNVWKSRLLLNYKGLPYRTEWVSPKDIDAKLRPHVFEPNEQGRYTVPTVVLPGGKAVMDSAAIADMLEKLYPGPTLRIDERLHDKLGPILAVLGPALIPIFMPRVARDVVVESDEQYFRENRAMRFGMPLDEMEKTKGGEPAWEAAEPGLRQLSAFLTENKEDEGPFALGSQVCYADFMVVALLEGMRRIGQDIFDRLVGQDENLRKLHAASQQWLERDD